MKQMIVNFEHTDTFAGESNYSWVHRDSFQAPDNVSDRALVRKAKAWAGLSGVRSRVDKHGDLIAIYPQGICHVVFITFGD
jgi:hypothetical protein